MSVRIDDHGVHIDGITVTVQRRWYVLEDDYITSTHTSLKDAARAARAAMTDPRLDVEVIMVEASQRGHETLLAGVSFQF